MTGANLYRNTIFCIMTRRAERWARRRRAGAAGGAGRAGKRWGVGAGALGRAGCDTAMQAATRPALAATRPGQGPRYGHCARLGAPGCA